MPDDLIRIRLDRADLERLSFAKPDGTFIGRLSAAARMEAGPVESQGLALDGKNQCLRFETVAVQEIKTFGGWHVAYYFKECWTKKSQINLAASTATGHWCVPPSMV